MYFFLSRKHQLLQAYNTSLNFLYYDKIISEDARLLEQNTVFQEINKIHKIYENQFYFSFSASFKGITYKKNSFVLYGKDSFGYYSLCEIEYLIIDLEFKNLYFFGTKICTCYNSINGLFEKLSIEDNSKIFISYKDLTSPETVLMQEIDGSPLFYFKSSPFEEL